MRFLLRWFTILALLVLITMLGGCGSLRKQGYVGAGAAAGAAGGAALGGPLGAAVGAAAGAIAVGATAESDELRSGDLVGEEALVRELDRWKVRALNNASEAALWQAQASAARATADEAQEAVTWKETLLKWLAILASAYLAWRNRTHIAEAAREGSLRPLWHALWGGKAPVPVGAAPAEDWTPPDPPGALPFRERIRSVQKQARKTKGIR